MKTSSKYRKEGSAIRKDSSKPFSKIKNINKDKDSERKNDLISPTKYNKNELSKHLKHINTNTNNTNSISNTMNNQMGPSSSSYNISFNSKKLQKFLNGRKNSKENKNYNDIETPNLNSKKTQKKFHRIIKKNLLERYLRINYYVKIQTDALVENRYCRIVALMRDNMIATSSDEYLRRYYKITEINERIPKIAKYYRNYLLFFCKPIFSNLFINKLIHVYGELKGELYYNQNYGNKNKEEKTEKNKDKEQNKKNNKNQKNSAMMFHTTIKDDIDKNSMTISTINKDFSYLNMNPFSDEVGTNNNENNKVNKSLGNLNKYNNNSKKKSLHLYYNDKKSSNEKNFRKNNEINKNLQKYNINDLNLNLNFNTMGNMNTNYERNNFSKENLASKILRKNTISSNKITGENIYKILNSNEDLRENFSNSKDVSIVNILNTIGENNNTEYKEDNLNFDLRKTKENSGQDSKTTEIPKSKKNKNSSIINFDNPNYSIGTNINNNNSQNNKNALEINTPKNPQSNRVLLIESTKDSRGNYVSTNQRTSTAITSNGNGLIPSNYQTLNNLNKFSEQINANGNIKQGNIKNYLNLMGMKGRIKSGVVDSNSVNKFKNDMKLGRVNSLNIQTGNFINNNNLIKSSNNLGNYQTTKNIRNSTNNIFSSKNSNNNSQLLGSLDLKTEISNRFNSKEKNKYNSLQKNLNKNNANDYDYGNLNAFENNIKEKGENKLNYLSNNYSNSTNKNSLSKQAKGKKNQKAETQRDTGFSLNSLNNNKTNFSNNQGQGQIKVNNKDLNFIETSGNINDLMKSSLGKNSTKLSTGNINNILSNFQNKQERTNSSNSKNINRNQFNSPDSLPIKPLSGNIQNSNKKIFKRNYPEDNKTKKNYIKTETNGNLLTNTNSNNYNYNYNNYNTNTNANNNSIKTPKINPLTTTNVYNDSKGFKLKDLFINTNTNTNNNTNKNQQLINNKFNNFISSNGNSNSNINLNNILTNANNTNGNNIITTNGNFNTENNINNFGKKENLTMPNEIKRNKNSNLISNNTNTNGNQEGDLNDMKITLNIKVNKNNNEITPFGQGLEGYENKLIHLNESNNNVGINNFNININNNINFNNSQHQTKLQMNQGQGQSQGNQSQNKFISSKRNFNKAKSNPKGNGNSLPLASGGSSANVINTITNSNSNANVINTNANTKRSDSKMSITHGNNYLTQNSSKDRKSMVFSGKKKEINLNKNIDMNDLANIVNFKGGNLRADIVSPKSINDIKTNKDSKNKFEMKNINNNPNVGRSNSTKNKKTEKIFRK